MIIQNKQKENIIGLTYDDDHMIDNIAIFAKFEYSAKKDLIVQELIPAEKIKDNVKK